MTDSTGQCGWAAVALGWLMASSAALAQTGTENGQWRSFGGDNAASRYAPLDQIDKANVARLGIAWRRLDSSILEMAPRLRAERTFRATPLMIDGVLYSPNGIGFVEAFDAGTGKTVWVEKPFESGPQGYRGRSTRGVAIGRTAAMNAFSCNAVST